MTLLLWSIILATLASVLQAQNPFKGQKFYINPVNKKEYDSSIARTTGKIKHNLMEMRKVPSAYWIDVKAKTHGHTTMTVPGILADAAKQHPVPLVVFIWYDLPNRDCDAKASNGEICCHANTDGTCNYDKVSNCADGLKDYKENYCDPFISALKQYKGKVPTVVVVEPDSLPNLASNADHPHCGNPATKAAYTQGYKYAVDQLTSETDAAIYLDAAHGGWLGWDDNMRDFLKILDGMNMDFSRIRGFATNVANYQPLGQMCPFKPDQGYRNAFCLNGRHKSHPCCEDPCDLLGQYNPGNGEFNFAQDLQKAAKGELGWDAHMVIDTGRAGVSDMRQLCKNWCNPRNAGAGPRSTTDVCMPDMIDAYFWLKTPGECDGCTQELPNGDTCQRFDTMCGSIDSIGSHPDEPKAPEAGGWFEYQVEQLAANAHLDNFPCPSPASLVVEEEETGNNNNQQFHPQNNNQQSTWGNNNQQSQQQPQNNNQQSTWGNNNQQPQNNNAFGNNNQQPQQQPQNNNAFGNNNNQQPANNNAFGNNNNMQQPQNNNAFGNNNQQTPNNNAFGNNNNNNQQPQNNNAFGNNNQQTPNNAFGNNQQPQNNNAFGNNNQQPQNNNAFGNQQSQPQTNNAFGNNNQASQPSSSQSTWGQASQPTSQSTWGQASQPSPSPSSMGSSSTVGSSSSSGVCCWGQTTCGEAKGCQGGFCGQSEANCKGNCGGTYCPASTLRLFESQPHLRPATDASTITPFVVLASFAGVALVGALFLVAWKAATRRTMTPAASHTPRAMLLSQNEGASEE